ncbi:MAG TPA: type II secretion system minor pseudopilin GspK [Gammaproteobacteria bacterium]|nr:type II secretion system minor pseudopilin GspK [Gammaproteobacteria bacterium]
MRPRDAGSLRARPATAHGGLPRRQRGVAAITAILMVALATVIAVNLVWENNLDQRRTGTLLSMDQALQYAFGAEAWAAHILLLDLQNTPTDHLGEDWAIALPPLPLDGGELAGRLEDLQGRFNINNLVTEEGVADPLRVAQFERLLEALGLDVKWAQIAVDWLDRDIDESFPAGAEDDVYTALIPPYRAANQPIGTTSELMALADMDRATFELLRPHIAALPIGSRINVNTATAPVLQSLSGNIGSSEATSLIEARADTGFPDYIGAFDDLVEPEVLDTLVDSTQYLRLTAQVSIGTSLLTMYSLLQRSDTGAVTPLMRSFGAE